MTVIRDLISDTLENIGVTASGETPSASDLQTSLRAFNRMIDSWSTERLALYEMPREVFELVGGKSSYTIGETGDFSTKRPMEIIAAAYGALIKTPVYVTPEPTEEIPDPEPVLDHYDLSVNFEFPVKVLDYQTWICIPDKSLSSEVVHGIYAQGTSLLETIHTYPVSSGELGLVLYSKKALSKADDADAEITLPPGYEQAIIDNLSLILAGLFGRPVTQEMKDTARESKANIKRQNTQVARMKSDADRLSTTNKCRIGDIFSGGYR